MKKLLSRLSGRLLSLLIALALVVVGINHYGKSLLLSRRTRQIDHAANHITDYLNKRLARFAGLLGELAKQPMVHEVTHGARAKNAPLASIEQLKQDIATRYADATILDFFVVNSNGVIDFVLNKKELIGTNLRSKHPAKTALGRSFDLVSTVFDSDISRITNSLSKGKISVCISVPLVIDNKFEGIISLEIDCSRLEQKLQEVYPFGKTVEVLIGQMTDEQLMFTYPPRLHPNLVFKPMPPHDPLLWLAAQGDEQVKQYRDYRLHQVIGAGVYANVLSIGIVVKQDIDEVMHWPRVINYGALLFMLALLLLALLKLAVRSWPQMVVSCRRIAAWLAGVPLMLALSLVGGLSLCALLSCIVSLRHFNKNAHEKQYTESKITLQQMLQHLNGKLDLMATEAVKVAKMLKGGAALQPEQIAATALKQLAPGMAVIICLKPDSNGISPLFTLWTLDGEKLVTHDLSKAYDDMVSDDLLERAQAWYAPALEAQAVWLTPFNEQVTGKKFIARSELFGEGAVLIAWAYDSFCEQVKQDRADNQRVLLIADGRGKMVMHPEEYVTKYDTPLTDLAGEKYFDQVGLQEAQTKQILQSYLRSYDRSSGMYLFDNVSASEWICATSFAANPRLWPVSDLQKRLIILLLLILLCACALLIFVVEMRAGFAGVFVSRRFLMQLTGVLLLANIILWCIAFYCSRMHEERATVMTCQHDVTRAVGTIAEHGGAHAQTLIPTGITLHGLDLTQANMITFNAYVWQFIPAMAKEGITPGVSFIGSISLDEELVMKKETPRGQYLLWKMHVKLAHPDNYVLYPFHKKLVSIKWVSRDATHPVLLVPDFTTYATLGGEHPWLEATLKTPGFYLSDAYFSYNSVAESKSTKSIVASDQLALNLLYYESMAGAVVIYLIPLMLIIFTMFALLWIAVEFRITAYSGVFFSTIMLHRALRTTYAISDIIYLEYFFFFIYVTLLLLVLCGVWQMIRRRRDSNDALGVLFDEYARLLYWPLQCSFWIIATVMTFYGG